jgi:sigma-E factor negative regulatory protein RseB
VPRTAAVPGGKPLAGAQLVRLRAAGWPLPVQLPGQLTLVRATQTGGPSDVVVDLAYSDGLSVISLFIQRGHLPAQLNGWSEVALRGHRVYASGPDQRSVAWSARGFVFTLIADAPDQTLTRRWACCRTTAGQGSSAGWPRPEPAGFLARPVPVSPGVRAGPVVPGSLRRRR